MVYSRKRRRSGAVAAIQKKFKVFKSLQLPDTFSNIYNYVLNGQANARSYTYIAEMFDAADLVQVYASANNGTQPSYITPFFVSYEGEILLKSCSTADQDIEMYHLKVRRDMENSMGTTVVAGETFADTGTFIRNLVGGQGSTGWTTDYNVPVGLDVFSASYPNMFFISKRRRFRLRGGESAIFKFKRKYRYCNPIHYLGMTGSFQNIVCKRGLWEQVVCLIDGGPVYNTAGTTITVGSRTNQSVGTPAVQIVCKERYNAIAPNLNKANLSVTGTFQTIATAKTYDERTGQSVSALGPS